MYIRRYKYNTKLPNKTMEKTLFDLLTPSEREVLQQYNVVNCNIQFFKVNVRTLMELRHFGIIRAKTTGEVLQILMDRYTW